MFLSKIFSSENISLVILHVKYFSFQVGKNIHLNYIYLYIFFKLLALVQKIIEIKLIVYWWHDLDKWFPYGWKSSIPGWKTMHIYKKKFHLFIFTLTFLCKCWKGFDGHRKVMDLVMTLFTQSFLILCKLACGLCEIKVCSFYILVLPKLF